MSARTWVVTGGAGYIGSHVVRALAESGRRPLVVDDLSSGFPSRVPDDVPLEEMSVLDADGITRLLGSARPAGVIHLAGKKFPEESVENPLLYAKENAGGVVSLVEAARAADVPRIVFSSSCSVYGTPDLAVVDETSPTIPESPYGESKLYGERVLSAAATAYGLGVISLRYFNVVGAAAAELKDTSPRNLVPLVLGAAKAGRSPIVFGSDYPTPDGTCIRDYVDVRDVADAHVRSADALEQGRRTAVYNIGRGQGSSVLEVLAAVRRSTGLALPHEFRDRRPGDPARIVGSADRIARELGWSARHDLQQMVDSAWNAER